MALIDDIKKTIAKAEIVKTNVIRQKAKLEQLMDRLKSEHGLESVDAARVQLDKLKKEIADLEVEMRAIHAELDEALPE